jgi:hypothetical protein
LTGKGRPEQPGGLLHCPLSKKVSAGEFFMPITTIIIIVLILVLIGAVPAWPHSRSWGYGPSGIVGVMLVVLLVLLLMGRL